MLFFVYPLCPLDTVLGPLQAAYRHGRALWAISNVVIYVGGTVTELLIQFFFSFYLIKADEIAIRNSVTVLPTYTTLFQITYHQGI